MPTKPFEPLLYRELAKVAAKEIIDIASPLLQELVNYATNAFQRCQMSSTDAEDEDLPVLVSYLHVIEMTDGIEVLISQSCSNPAVPLLRSSFEALLAIRYILEADYQQRSLSWIVGYVHSRIEGYETLDASSPRGRDFLTALSTDETRQYLALPSMPELEDAIPNLQSMLRKPKYQPIEAEYERLRQKRKRPPMWYNLFGGPPNLRELARTVERGAQYDVLYRQWSTITHATDVSHYLTRTANGTPAFKPLRNAEELRTISAFAASFILNATRKALSKFRPGEEASLKSWYLREIGDRYLLLSK